MISENLLEDLPQEYEEKIDFKDKNERMLNKYFRKPKNIDDKELTKKEKIKLKDCEKHLYIDYIELRNFKDILDKIYFNDKGIKYGNFFFDLKLANIYPGNKEINYYEFKIPDYSFFKDYLFMLILMISSYILLLYKKYILFIIIYIINAIVQIIYFLNDHFSWKELKGDYLKKLEKILNARPVLELYYGKKCISKIPFHSYADISGIQFVKNDVSEDLIFERIDFKNDKIAFQFPIKFLYFVDSTQQYFKFLILEFYKYCQFKSGRYSGNYNNMYLKYYFETNDNQIIYKTDPFFFTTFTTINKFKINLIFACGILTQLSPILIFISNFIIKGKLIDIKKTVSIKHDIEKYLNLDALFLKFINADIEIKRQTHNPISDRESIQEKFKKECINIYNMKIDLLNDLRKPYGNKFNPDLEIERQGYLTPFSIYSTFYYGFEYFKIEDFYIYYGTKVKKIMDIEEKEIFRNFFGVIKKTFYAGFEHFKENERIYYNKYDRSGQFIEDNLIENDNFNLFRTDNNSYEDEEYDNNENEEINDNNYENLREVIYTERSLTLKIEITHNFVYVNYDIRLPNNSHKTGKFSLAKKFGGFTKLEEKVNPEWTKSEIYIPTSNYVIEIIRKKRAIKLSAGDNEIISDTIINDDLHAGAISWLNGEEWDKYTIDKYVKDCNRNSLKNRFKTKYN